MEMCEALKEVNPFWIEEPTQPDDVFAHQALVKAGYRIAVGESAFLFFILWNTL